MFDVKNNLYNINVVSFIHIGRFRERYLGEGVMVVQGPYSDPKKVDFEEKEQYEEDGMFKPSKVNFSEEISSCPLGLGSRSSTDLLVL